MTYTSTTGTITNIAITPENTIISAVTSITVQFLPKHRLEAANTEITISLPSDVSITQQTNSATCTISDHRIISPTTQCTVVGRVITLINPFAVAYTPSSTEILGFKIAGMTMPASTKAIGDATFTTIVSSFSVDTATGSTLFVATPGSITGATVTPTSTQTYTTTTYKFSFVPQHAVLQNGYVTVDVPTEITVADTASATCTSDAGYEAGITCTVASRKITVRNGFNSATFGGGGTLTFSITNILSPVSTSTTSSFTVSILTK